MFAYFGVHWHDLSASFPAEMECIATVPIDFLPVRPLIGP